MVLVEISKVHFEVTTNPAQCGAVRKLIFDFLFKMLTVFIFGPYYAPKTPMKQDQLIGLEWDLYNQPLVVN